MLSIRNISKTYENGYKALDSVTLDIESGMFGLLGPNGAGKSSLMRTIATLQEPTHGQILFDNKDIIANPNIVRGQLGYLPQEFNVYPKISCYKLLDHIALLKGVLDNKERKEQINTLLEQTNLYDFRKKPVSNYSGGMRQRFGIAQALLGNPKLIIVDEPTAGLDPEERNRFYNLLCDIGKDIVVILSTHIVEDVNQLCPNFAVLSNGKVILQGKPKELIDKVQGNIWRKIISKGQAEIYMDQYDVISSRLNSGNIEITIYSNSQPALGFNAVPPTLEDVYFSALKIRKGKKHVS
jgi:ABC-type multidrug transport system ATPase subunit